MNFFTNELKRFFGNRDEFQNASYIGRACYVLPENNLRIKIQFVNDRYSNYNSIMLQAFNNEQDVDTTMLHFSDYWQTSGQKFIWICDGQPKWFACSPTSDEINSLVDDISDFISIYQDNSMSDVSMGGM